MSDDYRQGQLDMLVRLLRETQTTQTNTDILMAAYDSHFIPKAIVDDARSEVCGDKA
jgi:hypothetical protein